MSATRTKVRWTEFEIQKPFAIAMNRPKLFVRLGVEPSERRCPSCNSVVYSRRHQRCGVCDHKLPESCLFTPGEAKNIEALMKRERDHHKDWLRKSNGTHAHP
jgi:hypothetical protein